MLAGISTACLYPQKTEEAMAVIAGLGAQAAEVFLNSHSELAPPYLRQLRAIADQGGTKILSIHPFTSGMEPMLFFTAYPRRFEDGREYYRRYYQAANLLGASIVVFHGGVAGLTMERERYFERFACLMEDARQQGVELCHENVSRCTGHAPSFFADMSRRLPQARYVFDLKQAVRAGEDALCFAQTMGKKIAHVHLSDHNACESCLPIGKGVFHIQNFLYYLHSQNFCGGVIVELYRENFGGIVELSESYQQLCTYLSTMP